MKKKLKTIPKLWNEFEFSLDRPSPPYQRNSVNATADADGFHCVADCAPELAGMTIACLLNNFSDTPTNVSRVCRGIAAWVEAKNRETS
ncbi:hypothetical protein [Ethanoligenens sp.]|uniref:hypothetical protein n=1 Tax=Ethanoligenens sp. TaxID=2099655 RepID=UPI0039EAE4FF